MNHPYSVHLREQYGKLFEMMEKHPTKATVAEEEELTQTSNAQPAILAHSMLLWELFQNSLTMRKKDDPMFEKMKICSLSGHSLGEYIALPAAGILNFEDSMKFVEARGKVMERMLENEVLRDSTLHHQQRENKFGMLALIPCDKKKAEQLVKTFHDQTQHKWFLEVTNVNSDKQVILSGSQEAFHYLKTFFSLKKKWGILLPQELKVSIPFHSSLLRPVGKMFEPYVDKYIPIDENDSELPTKYKIFSNVTTQTVATKSELNSCLKQQVYTPIDWYGCALNICKDLADQKKKIEDATDNEVRTFVLEMGPKNILADLMNAMSFKNIEKPFNVLHLSTESSMSQFLDSLA